MNRIKIKIKNDHTALLAQLLHGYGDLLPMHGDMTGKEDIQIRYSIAIELHFRFQKLATTRYAPKDHLISLELHHALVLKSALTWYSIGEENDYNRNAMDMIKNNLFQKITDLSLTTT